MAFAEEHYREYAPIQALSPYVACYWTSVASGSPAARRVLPDGCIDILFNLRDGVYSKGTIIGAMTRPFLFETRDPVHLVAVRFRPGGAIPFLRLSADEVTDAHLALNHVWEAGELVGRLHEEVDNERKVRCLESELLARLSQRCDLDDRVQAAVSWLEKEARDVDAVAAAVAVSRQHLIRLFRRHVGLSPKKFARVMRMQRLRSLLRSAPRPDWASLALDAGYYDQSHMIAECRLLAGLTPTQLSGRSTASSGAPSVSVAATGSQPVFILVNKHL
jgi:AraC-like DNA-binding protein